MEVYKKLLKIQSKLKAPKTQYNSFGKYNYRNCEDILESIKPLLAEVEATLVISDAIINIQGRFYVESTVKFIDAETGDLIENKGLAREDETKKGQDLSQVTGSTSSYARKYALNGLFCIDDNKDSDSTNTHGKDKTESKPKAPQNNTKVGVLNDAQIKRLYAIAHSKNVAPETVKAQVLKKFNKKVDELTKDEYDIVCKGYEGMNSK